MHDELQIAITTVAIVVLACIWLQLFLLKQKVDKQDEEQQKLQKLCEKGEEQQKEVQKEEQLQPGNVMKVFEQIKANQEKLQKDMEKVQMQTDIYGQLQQQSADGHQNPVLGQIRGNQLKIQEDMAKVQVQIGKYGDIFQLVNSNERFKLKPIRKIIRFAIKNCAELFKQLEFNVDSDAIEVLGFNWYLLAKTGKKGFLSVYLHADQRDGFNGHYRMEVDLRISLLNAFRDKDLARVLNGKIYTTNANCFTGWGFVEMAEFKDLLDSAKGFLRPDGSMEVEADFTIKSATLDHLI